MTFRQQEIDPRAAGVFLFTVLDAFACALPGRRSSSAACVLQPTIRGHVLGSLTALDSLIHLMRQNRLIRCNGLDHCRSPSGLIEVVCPWHFADAFAFAGCLLL
jgi:hypothetical protein